MVDFQSRDTRRNRSVTEDDDVDEETEPAADGTERDAADAETADAATADGAAETDGPTGGIAAAVVTVSEDRTHDDDPAGETVVDAFEAAGHRIVTRELVRPGHDTIQQTIDTLAERDDVDAIVTTGATGVGPDDVTVDSLHPLIDKYLPGFGELFRARYVEQIGTDVVSSRATAGISGGTPVFCLPGDPDGARLGTEEIVVEQAPRLADLANREGASDE